ncbi:hypothetical protein K2Q02_02020, partial [Patescibacteria group bacterium]|nr:hypothetical protein [Patescibacteria group bacterium]
MEKTSFLKRILFFFKPFWVSFAWVIGLLFIGQLFTVVSPLLFSRGVDAVINGDVRLTGYFLI